MKIDYTIFYATLPGIAVLAIAECVEMIREHRFAKDKNNMFSSLFIGVVAIGISSFVKTTVLFTYIWLYQWRLLTLPAGCWWVWLVCFVGDDFSYYWLHRCSHQVRFLWASHVVHHSPETYSLSAALRIPWTSHFTGNFLFWCWMPLVGFSPVMIVTTKAINAVYQFWLHTEKIKKLHRWVEAVFNTPSHHRVHHASNVEYLDKNHGGTLIIFDRLLGTFAKETARPVYGLTKKLSSSNPFVILFAEWGSLVKDIRKAKSLGDLANFIFNSPGWCNNGESNTTKALRNKKLHSN
jgi:sterol desaturase/sphingolipid hydroxylase (fatty acid hydroxylase superfamily)